MSEGGFFWGTATEGAEPPMHVLVADDDDAMRETTVKLLEATLDNATVTGFPSARGVLDALADDASVDCIVSDYEMPEMSGLELLEAVRETDPDVPFVIYTGHGNEDVASDAISAGVTDYVRKSVTGGHRILANRIESAVARRRAEAERELQALAMSTVEEGIAVVDSEGRFVEVNGAYAETYGYDRDELVGESWEVINPPQENERMHLQILPTLDEQGIWRGESVGLRKDGSTFVKSKSLTKLDSGGFVCAVRDVTEQRDAEDALREQNERLREFARLVSHDLRNPLNVAEGYLTVVEESVDEELQDDVERIKTAHDRMRRLIDDMLRLAREGRLVDNAEAVPLTDVVETAALTVGLKSEGSCVVEEGLPSVYADEERLSALFENLFGNALEHAGPNPTVRVGPLTDDYGVCGFFVEDDGPGIPENRHVKVFESGFTTNRSGTGFGLAIVKRITTAHGWTVSVRDGRDGGARFEFRGVNVVDGAAAADGRAEPEETGVVTENEAPVGTETAADVKADDDTDADDDARADTDTDTDADDDVRTDTDVETDTGAVADGGDGACDDTSDNA
ncbi:hybrid sensor histidine kinase/response regulator [Salinigranum rubrum]|uniref:histidine kinase n=1 Tax=Salinigranum rubrum TaxID=755307 RepID=A0A2I8VL31_9EURY|nr:response regulator [Salinigranum rubrum]AUV82637.1 hybrid sensor histidine kinase/response regulator [Salinigranum rubrum]